MTDKRAIGAAAAIALGVVLAGCAQYDPNAQDWEPVGSDPDRPATAPNLSDSEFEEILRLMWNQMSPSMRGDICYLWTEDRNLAKSLLSDEVGGSYTPRQMLQWERLLNNRCG